MASDIDGGSRLPPGSPPGAPRGPRNRPLDKPQTGKAALPLGRSPAAGGPAQPRATGKTAPTANQARAAANKATAAQHAQASATDGVGDATLQQALNGASGKYLNNPYAPSDEALYTLATDSSLVLEQRPLPPPAANTVAAFGTAAASLVQRHAQFAAAPVGTPGAQPNMQAQAVAQSLLRHGGQLENIAPLTPQDQKALARVLQLDRKGKLALNKAVEAHTRVYEAQQQANNAGATSGTATAALTATPAAATATPLASAQPVSLSSMPPKSNEAANPPGQKLSALELSQKQQRDALEATLRPAGHLSWDAFFRVMQGKLSQHALMWAAYRQTEIAQAMAAQILTNQLDLTTEQNTVGKEQADLLRTFVGSALQVKQEMSKTNSLINGESKFQPQLAEADGHEAAYGRPEAQDRADKVVKQQNAVREIEDRVPALATSTTNATPPERTILAPSELARIPQEHAALRQAYEQSDKALLGANTYTHNLPFVGAVREAAMLTRMAENVSEPQKAQMLKAAEELDARARGTLFSAAVNGLQGEGNFSLLVGTRQVQSERAKESRTQYKDTTRVEIQGPNDQGVTGDAGAALQKRQREARIRHENSLDEVTSIGNALGASSYSTEDIRTGRFHSGDPAFIKKVAEIYDARDRLKAEKKIDPLQEVRETTLQLSASVAGLSAARLSYLYNKELQTHPLTTDPAAIRERLMRNPEFIELLGNTRKVNMLVHIHDQELLASGKKPGIFRQSLEIDEKRTAGANGIKAGAELAKELRFWQDFGSNGTHAWGEHEQPTSRVGLNIVLRKDDTRESRRKHKWLHNEFKCDPNDKQALLKAITVKQLPPGEQAYSPEKRIAYKEAVLEVQDSVLNTRVLQNAKYRKLSEFNMMFAGMSFADVYRTMAQDSQGQMGDLAQQLGEAISDLYAVMASERESIQKMMDHINSTVGIVNG